MFCSHVVHTILRATRLIYRVTITIMFDSLIPWKRGLYCSRELIKHEDLLVSCLLVKGGIH